MSRKTEIAAGLATVDARIRRACQAAGRSRSDVTVIVVTKTFPPGDIRALAELGIRDIGENRDQEAAAKAAACADLGLTWHFVGQLQTNKARSVTRYASAVHSVDRPKLVGALSHGAAMNGREIGCLVQVSVRGEPMEGRGGAASADVLKLADAIADAEALRLLGVMTVAPLDADPLAAFDQLARIAGTVQALHPRANWISAGMSQDLEPAIAAGATHLRVGSAILGRRPTAG
ncbi:MAG TPA: YggS family pyridoxal phosphate-dependent enzyme [Jiangellaceae bacterium]|nr:YggS family pyridoxal phosphate-dependent enzyme [Jiangellaceae bacterium]